MKCKAQAALISDSGGREYRFTPFLLEFTRPIDRLIRITPFNYDQSDASKEHFPIELYRSSALPRFLGITFSGLGCRRTFALRKRSTMRNLRFEPVRTEEICLLDLINVLSRERFSKQRNGGDIDCIFVEKVA